MEKLSIIIPVYNGENYIGALLDDLLKIDHHFCEIIAVNDGSVDDTSKIIEQYANHYNHIKLINQENAGPSHARNKGLDMATGTYIAFCDADDRIDAVQFMAFYEQAVVSSATYCFTGYIEQNFKTDKEQIITTDGEGTYNVECFVELIFPNLTKNLISYMFNKLFLKTIIDDNHIRFDEKVRYAEDLLFNLDYLKHVDSIYISKTNYYLYQKYTNENSLSTHFNMGFWNSRKMVYYKLNQLCSRVEFSQKYDVQINTYAINTMLYTINQIMSANADAANKMTYLKAVVEDEHLLNFINGEADVNSKQRLMLSAIRAKASRRVYMLGTANNLKWKIKNLMK